MKAEPTGKINYWGYTGGGIFAPKASYSSGKEKHPVTEFKELVKALHRAGLEIIVELFFTGNESPVYALDAVAPLGGAATMWTGCTWWETPP